MAHIMLPSPDGPVPLIPTLALVAQLEAEASLLKTAERLLSREIKIAEVVALLRICYREAGRAVTDEFLLAQSPALLLAEVLVAILAPLSAMGASLGERAAASGK